MISSSSKNLSFSEKYHPHYISEYHEYNFSIYNVSLYGIGVMTLWFGWLFFNAGSTLSVQPDAQESTERAMMNSILGPAAGGLGGFVVRKYLAGSTPDFRGVKYDPTGIMNGILCGLVAVTGNCAYIMAWAAIFIGGVAPIFYALMVRLVARLGVDDAAEAFPIHGPCGAWGIIVTAFLHETEGVIYGYPGKIIGVQIMGVVVITAWNIVTVGIVLLPIKLITQKIWGENWLRVPKEVEEIGIDAVDHMYIDNSEFNTKLQSIIQKKSS